MHVGTARCPGKDAKATQKPGKKISSHFAS
jgi:hypothetical protein